MLLGREFAIIHLGKNQQNGFMTCLIFGWSLFPLLGAWWIYKYMRFTLFWDPRHPQNLQNQDLRNYIPPTLLAIPALSWSWASKKWGQATICGDFVPTKSRKPVSLKGPTVNLCLLLGSSQNHRSSFWPGWWLGIAFGYDIHSSPWYRWPIEIDGLPNLKMGGSFHGELLNNQMVTPVF